MKTKKNNKRNHSTRNNSGSKVIVLKRETALKQLLDGMAPIIEGKGQKQVSFDARCFDGHEEEYDQVWEKFQRIMALRSALHRKTFCAVTIG